MFMDWGKQIKDCQSSIPAADGKGQGFTSRARMTVHSAMGEMMDRLARYSLWTEAEAELRKEVNKRVQIQCKQEGLGGTMTAQRCQENSGSRCEPFTHSLLMMSCFRCSLRLDTEWVNEMSMNTYLFQSHKRQMIWGDTIQKQWSWKLISRAFAQNFSFLFLLQILN